MSYVTEYDKLKFDAPRIELFRSSGEKDGTRIFTVLNSNIKTLKTVGEYIDTMYGLTSYDAKHKQKNERVRVFNFRSLDNHSDVRAITRSDIVRAAGAEFGGYDNAFVTLLLYILLLDVGDNEDVVVTGAKTFVNSLPIFIKRRLFEYARQIALSDSFPNDNLYQQIVVLYGDQELYKEFLTYVSEKYPDEATIKDLFEKEAADPDSPIAKRIKNFQPSALKKDALYTIIFYSLDQYVRKCRMRGLRTGKTIVDAEEFFRGFLEYFDDIFAGSLTWLGKMNAGDTIDTLQDFISNTLTEEQRDEMYKCIENAFELQIPEENE